MDKFPNLWVLDLSDNALTGEVPSSFGELLKLEHLYLHNNFLSGKLLEQPFFYKTRLEVLNVGDNLFSGTISTDIGLFRYLNTLKVGRQDRLSANSTAEEQARRLTGTIPTELGQLSILQWVILSGNRLTGSIPTEIAQFPLSSLALNYNELTGTFPTELALLSNIGM